MFHLAVVLESGDVVGGGLQAQDEAEFVIDLDRGQPAAAPSRHWGLKARARQARGPAGCRSHRRRARCCGSGAVRLRWQGIMVGARRASSLACRPQWRNSDGAQVDRAGEILRAVPRPSAWSSALVPRIIADTRRLHSFSLSRCAAAHRQIPAAWPTSRAGPFRAGPFRAGPFRAGPFRGG